MLKYTVIIKIKVYGCKELIKVKYQIISRNINQAKKDAIFSLMTNAGNKFIKIYSCIVYCGWNI